MIGTQAAAAEPFLVSPSVKPEKKGRRKAVAHVHALHTSAQTRIYTLHKFADHDTCNAYRG